MPSAEIITIGTEILLGEIVDTNTRHIARTLRNLGVDLYRTITVGDNAERIASTIRESMKRAQILITTGGLGPTVDDPTREAIAAAVGLETEFREELWEQVVSSIERYGRKPEENQKRQAVVPRGARAIRNPVGTAPAFVVETGESVIISLPGVPNEMEYILHESVVPYLQKHFDLHQVIKVRVLHCAGLGEGSIDEKIGDLELLGNPTVGLAAHTGVVDVRIAAKAESETEADNMIARIEEDIRRRLAGAVFGADEVKLEQVTLEAVSQRGWSLVAVESGLDGLLANRLPHTTSIPNLSASALLETVRQARQQARSDAALGVSVHSGELSADLVLITPGGEKTRRITYGGPPRSLPRWAMNLALNWLRNTAMEVH